MIEKKSIDKVKLRFKGGKALDYTYINSALVLIN